MTDYHTVIAQAVESLDRNTSRNRRVLYERARTAQVTHLRAIHPPLSESAIAKERLSLARNVSFDLVRSTGQCNTACSLLAGVSKPKVFRGR
jgi:hypothetical protein